MGDRRKSFGTGIAMGDAVTTQESIEQACGIHGGVSREAMVLAGAGVCVWANADDRSRLTVRERSFKNLGHAILLQCGGIAEPQDDEIGTVLKFFAVSRDRTRTGDDRTDGPRRVCRTRVNRGPELFGDVACGADGV